MLGISICHVLCNQPMKNSWAVQVPLGENLKRPLTSLSSEWKLISALIIYSNKEKSLN